MAKPDTKNGQTDGSDAVLAAALSERSRRNAPTPALLRHPKRSDTAPALAPSSDEQSVARPPCAPRLYAAVRRLKLARNKIEPPRPLSLLRETRI